MNKKNLLIIFTKNPVAGNVKTRLARDIGEENALEIYKFLLDHSFKITTALNITKQVHYSEDVPDEDLWDQGDFDKKLQYGKDLGIRMENAFRDGFRAGFEKIVIIGTDLLELRTEDIEFAFSALDNKDYVIGPAEDGGYYLFGMTELNTEVFRNKTWSTPSVFEDTLKNIKNSRIELLRTQNDIDVLDDIIDHPTFQKFLKYDRQN